jgi:hypothetical protein
MRLGEVSSLGTGFLGCALHLMAKYMNDPVVPHEIWPLKGKSQPAENRPCARLPAMTSSHAVRRLLVVLVIALPVAAVWLAFDNPQIHGTSRGDDYGCSAPYDTVLNDADNFPGGDPPPDGEDIARRCREAGEHRFRLALGTAAATVPAGAALLAVRRRQPSIQH